MYLGVKLCVHRVQFIFCNVDLYYHKNVPSAYKAQNHTSLQVASRLLRSFKATSMATSLACPRIPFSVVCCSPPPDKLSRNRPRPAFSFFDRKSHQRFQGILLEYVRICNVFFLEKCTTHSYLTHHHKFYPPNI